MINKAKLSNPDHSLGEVTNLLDSGKKSGLQHKSSFKPRRINTMFKPLNLIVMTLIISILTAVLLINPWGARVSEDAVANKELRVEKDIQAIQYPDTNIQKSVIDTSEESKTVKPSIFNKKTEESFYGETQNPLSKDSIQGTIFELSKDQLNKLGFVINDDGFYYLNEQPDGSLLSLWSRYVGGMGGDCGFGRTNISYRLKQLEKLTPTKHDFYPVFITDRQGDISSHFPEVKVISKGSFDENCNQLIPLLFRYKEVGGYNKSDIILWFKPSLRFLEILEAIEPSDQRLITMTEMILDLNGAININYNFEEAVMIEPIQIIKLDRQTLECLGFTFSEENIKFQYQYQGDMFHYRLDTNGGVASGFWAVNKIEKVIDSIQLVNAPPMLFSITNSRRKMMVGFESIKNRSRIDETNPIILDLCVPVKINDYTGKIPLEDFVFWFYPNEHFFDCLPDSIGEPMKKEFNFHKKELGIEDDLIIEDFVPTNDKKVEEVPCEYFPSFCEGLPGLDDLNVYPNPANEMLNMEVILSRGKSIDYRIFDLSGRLLVDDMPTRKYSKEGKYTEKMDVSGLTPGLYLLVLTDDEGARMTKRVVKN